MNYKTYTEAKIANPDSEIFTNDKDFKAVKDAPTSHFLNGWAICNPADYCSSIKEFLEAGFKFSVGDLFLGVGGEVIVAREASKSSVPYDDDYKLYILSSVALNGGCKIPAKEERWTIYNNTLPLCELTDEQVGKLVKHSGCVEHMNPNSGDWGATITPMWNRLGIYRIKSKSERELFIDEAIKHAIKPETQSVKQIFGELFDSGRFKYIDNAQHFGENI